MMVYTQCKVPATRKKIIKTAVRRSNVPSNPLYEQHQATRIKYRSVEEDAAHVPKDQIRYEGELAEREKLAQEEIERKKLQTAPAYSKGAYQYISEMDLPYLGRKI